MSSPTQDPVCGRDSTCGCSLHDDQANSTDRSSCCGDLLLNCPTPKCSKEKCCSKVKDFLPFLNWAPNYQLGDLQGDVIAGVTVALTVIPQGLAYASVARLPPQYGLYSAFMGCFVYVFLGTAKDITLGPTAIMSLMVGQFGKGNPTLAVTMTLVAGLIQFAMGLLNLGILIDFISFPVISAFTSAAAVTIATTQIKSLFGLKGVPNEFLPAIEAVFEKIQYTQFGDMTIGFISIVVLYAMKRVKSLKWTEASFSANANSDGAGGGERLSTLSRVLRRIVWLLCTARNAIVVLVTAVICFCLDTNLASSDFANLHISLTPDVGAGLPHVGVPRFRVKLNGTEVTALETVGVGYVVVALIGILESIAIGKAFARLGNYKIRPSQEMVAMGVANVVSSFFSSYPITGSFSRTAVNFQTGVKTPLGGVFTGGVVLLALGLLAPMFKYIPKAALAAVIISSVIPMFDYGILLKFWRLIFLGHLRHSALSVFVHHVAIDVLPWLGTFLCCLFVGLEYGILLGVGISLMPLFLLIARPPLHIKDDLTTFAGRVNDSVVILTPRFGMSFPAAEEFADRANDAANVEEEEEDEETEEETSGSTESNRWLSVITKKSTNKVGAKRVRRRHLIVDGSEVVTLDFSVLQMLAELSGAQKRHGRLLVLCNFDSRSYSMLDGGLITPFHYCQDVSHALELINRFDVDAVSIPLN